MLLKKADWYTFSNLENFKKLVVATSTQALGDMREPKNQARFFRKLAVVKPKVVRAQQIHGSHVKIISSRDGGKRIEDCDGLVTTVKNLYLMILVADCLPIVAFDPKKEIVGIAHAGWRGTLKGIAGNLIQTFVKIGAEPKDILVGLGPGVEFCHYEVKKEVADEFINAGLGKPVIKSVSGKICIDLKSANMDQLIKEGIPKNNIDITIKSCTYETSDFYSYRRDKTGKRVAVVVGIKDE